MFGRRKREAAEAVREADRRALFARLAQRPEHICPFLGLAAERTGYIDGVSDEHRCYAFGDPAPLSAEQQTRVCQERGYGNCPRYLRGVLVIPTEELEALRRPRPAAPYVPPPPTTARQQGRRRAAPLLVVVVLILAVGAGGGVAWLLLGNRLVGGPTETATPEPTPSASLEASVPPSVAPTTPPSAEPTAEPTGTPRPTPRPEDVFDHYQVQVEPGDYEVFRVNEAGDLVDSLIATFSRVSEAPVDRIEAPGIFHWRTAEGELTGWSYVYPDSGDFKIWAVYQRVEGDFSYELLPEDEL